MCRFHTQDFIQIQKKIKSNKEFFCTFDPYRQFRFHWFWKFQRLVDGISFDVAVFFSDERYQVHQKISLVIGKSDEFFLVWVWIWIGIFLLIPKYIQRYVMWASFIMHKTFQAGCLNSTCLYATIKQPVWVYATNTHCGWMCE